MDPQPLEDFSPFLNIEVDGVPRPFMLDALRHTCVEFCQQTLLATETLPAITMSANVSEYELEPSLCDSEVARVLDVWVNGARIAPVTPTIGRQMLMRSDSSSPAAYYCTSPGELVVVPAPATASSLVVAVAVMPASDADNVPDMLYKNYRGAIIRGAAARLMLMPSRPWTNVEHGALYRKLYWNEMHSVHRADHWDGFAQPIQRPMGRFL